MYRLITNREVNANGFGDDFSELTFWQGNTNDSKQLAEFSVWQKSDEASFRQALVQVADTFPDPLHTPSEDQKHVNMFVHGFDNTWAQAVGRYATIADNLFSGSQSLGECILFSWPSKGNVAGYFPDRSEARRAAEDLANVLSSLYDWMLMKQAQAAADPNQACKATTSVIAHSMGNYVVQNAMNVAWTRKNRPLLMSLISQLVMVAADVDNDIFGSGELVEQGEGEGVANLTYRATALYTGRDSVLGMSAGLKHFGKRRLGRSGLDRTTPLPDNVWDIDCSALISPSTNGMEAHGAYFQEPKCYALMRDILRGIDRTVLNSSRLIPAGLPKQQS